MEGGCPALVLCALRWKLAPDAALPVGVVHGTLVERPKPLAGDIWGQGQIGVVEGGILGDAQAAEGPIGEAAHLPVRVIQHAADAGGVAEAVCALLVTLHVPVSWGPLGGEAGSPGAAHFPPDRSFLGTSSDHKARILFFSVKKKTVWCEQGVLRNGSTQEPPAVLGGQW